MIGFYTYIETEPQGEQRMVLPDRSSIQLPLLKVLAENGGQLPTAKAIDEVTKYFPQITPEDVARQQSPPWRGSYWRNRVRWARQDLLHLGQLDDSVRGVWKITDKGSIRLEREWSSWKPGYQETFAPSESKLTTVLERAPEEILDSTLSVIREDLAEQLLDILLKLESSSFEQLIAQLLEKMGYGNVQVTGRSGDGAIDGTCSLEALGLVKVVFQAKKWTSRVGAQEIQKFIGGMTRHGYDYGIFVATSDFTQDAIETAKTPAKKVKLVDGKGLARLMIEFSLGISKITYELPRIDRDFFETL